MLSSKTIEVTLTLVTPAFAGGAYSHAVDTLRPPTIKSLLRWWWRTKHPRWNSQELYNAEAVVWGSAPFRRERDDPNKPPRGGQGTPLIPGAGIQKIQADKFEFESNALRYLAFGAMAEEGEQPPESPSCLPAGTQLTFRLVAPRNTTDCLVDDPVADLYHALWLMSAFGGVGQRSRRGWGSVHIATNYPEGLPDVHISTNPAQAIAEGLQTILGDRNKLPEGDEAVQRPLFSKASRVLVGSSQRSWTKALEEVGRQLFNYRKRLGSRQDGAGPDCKKRRSWFEALDGKTEDDQHPIPEKDRSLPRGSAFGLPHNAYFKQEEKTLRVGVGPDLGGRRASPLLISVIGTGKAYHPVVLWLPGLFLPVDLVPHAAVDEGQAFPVYSYDTNGIQEFLDGSGEDTDVRWRGLAKSKGWQKV